MIRQLNLGQAESFVDSELSRLNTEIRAILSLGGVVSQSGHVLEIGLDDAPVNQDFKSKLIEQGIVVDTAAFANKVLEISTWKPRPHTNND